MVYKTQNYFEIEKNEKKMNSKFWTENLELKNQFQIKQKLMKNKNN